MELQVAHCALRLQLQSVARTAALATPPLPTPSLNSSTMSASNPFEGTNAGTKVGLEVWRIENLQRTCNTLPLPPLCTCLPLPHASRTNATMDTRTTPICMQRPG